MTKLLATVPFLVGLLGAISFKPVGYFDNGMAPSGGQILVFDANRDGFDEIAVAGRVGLNRPQRLVFYKYTPWSRYVAHDSLVRPLNTGCYFWAIGYVDDDSLPDLVAPSDSMRVFESIDPRSYPKVLVWADSGHYYCSKIVDLDRDGKKEILTWSGDTVWVIENIANNQYERVWADTCPTGIFSSEADFDQDGKMEFVGLLSEYSFGVVECTGDNQYQMVYEGTVTSCGNHDLGVTDDLDGDGRPEFIIGGRNRSLGGSWTGQLWVYEATGDNEYSVILHDSLTDLPGDNAYATQSHYGDIDADGMQELIWAVKNNWTVYKATGNNAFERIFTAWQYGNGHGTTHVYVHDMNKNGYPEIIESGEGRIPGHETFIWEIEGVRLHQPNGLEVLVPGSQYPITWEKFTPPGADSFSLFVSYDNGVNYQTIATIQQSNDTLFLWSVPDTLADSCKLMIWAYGPPRAGQQVPRGTAWDFSDSTFAIRQTAVGEEAMGNRQWAGLQIRQNPARKALDIIRRGARGNGQEVKLKIYDITGKMVKELWKVPAERWVTVELNPGVYFVRLETEAATVTKKVVVVE